MADQQAAVEAAVEPKIDPKCPHCGEQPIKVRMMQFVLKPSTVCGAFMCGNPACATVLSVQMIGTLRPEKPAIVVPGMRFNNNKPAS